MNMKSEPFTRITLFCIARNALVKKVFAREHGKDEPDEAEAEKIRGLRK